MTPLIVEGKTLMVAPAINGHNGFDCHDCGLRDYACVRIRHDTGELYFDKTRDLDSRGSGMLYCISEDQDLVFIGDNPEDIAKYVAARLEKS